MKRNVPLAFIIPRHQLDASEVLLGIQEEWLLREDVINHLQSLGFAEFHEESEDETHFFSKLIERLKENLLLSESAKDARMTWLRILLAWIYENRLDFSDPFDLIEELYADFGYPDEIHHLIRFNVPYPDSGAHDKEKSMLRLTELWREYCDLHMGLPKSGTPEALEQTL